MYIICIKKSAHTNQCKTIDKDQLEQSLVNHRHQIDENTRAEDAKKRGSMVTKQTYASAFVCNPLLNE
jgi:hypothetical protein